MACVRFLRMCAIEPMNELPRRTRGTGLTYDQLLLFDFLFPWSVPERCLRREVYSFHMNVGYSHNLDDGQLQETLLRLSERGLVTAETDGADTRWSLTPLGARNGKSSDNHCGISIARAARKLFAQADRFILLCLRQETSEHLSDRNQGKPLSVKRGPSGIAA